MEAVRGEEPRGRVGSRPVWPRPADGNQRCPRPGDAGRPGTSVASRQLRRAALPSASPRATGLCCRTSLVLESSSSGPGSSVARRRPRRGKKKRKEGPWDLARRLSLGSRPTLPPHDPPLPPPSLPLLLSRESRSLAGRLTSASCCILATLRRSRRRWTRQAISHVWSLTTQRRRPFVYRSADLNPSPCRLRSSVSTLDRATPRSVSLAVRPHPFYHRCFQLWSSDVGLQLPSQSPRGSLTERCFRPQRRATPTALPTRRASVRLLVPSRTTATRS
jgi:hypothetical protein